MKHNSKMINLAHSILGTDNKNINWKKIDKYLDEYIKTINKVHTIKNKETIFYIVDDLRNTNVISEKTKKIVLETLDIDESIYKNSITKDTNNFESYTFDRNTNISDSEIDKYKEIIEGNKHSDIRIKNEDIQSAHNKKYYEYELKDFLNVFTDNIEGNNALKALRDGDFVIGENKYECKTGNICGTLSKDFVVKFKKDDELRAKFLTINWTKIINEVNSINKEKNNDDFDYDY